MKKQIDPYDRHLRESYGQSTIDYLTWASQLPFFLRFFLRKYIAGHRTLRTFTSFVFRNPSHELTQKFHMLYKKATFKEYYIRDEAAPIDFKYEKEDLITLCYKD